MSRAARFLLLLIAVLLAAPAGATEAGALRKLNILETLTVPEDDPFGLLVTVNNRAGLEKASVIRQGDEVWFDLPQTYVRPGRRYFNHLKSQCFKRATAIQMTKDMVRVVLIPRPEFLDRLDPKMRLDDEKTVRLAMNGFPPAQPKPAGEALAIAAVKTEATPELQENEKKLKAILEAEKERQQAETEAAPDAAEAEAQAVVAATDTAPAERWSAATVKMAVALCSVLAGIFFLVYLAKRFRLPSRLTGGQMGQIRVVQTGMLDLKRRLAVVDVAGELIVVALTKDGVTMLTKLESAEARRRLLGEGGEPAAAASFHRPEAVEPGAFYHQPTDGSGESRATQTSDGWGSADEARIAEPATWETPVDRKNESFNSKLRAYTRHAPSESAAAGHETLQAIAMRVKGLKRL